MVMKMKFDYQYKLIFTNNKPFDVNYINNFCQRYPNDNVLVEIENTKGITSSQLKKLNPNVAIRIAGGYTEERIKNKGNIKYSKETGEYYTSAVIYSRNEVINIINEIERIELGINKNWSELQKLIYIYDRLKTGILYDPKYKQKFSNEIRSLRGLVSKQTVCAGYALILKEFMDRQGIECQYVEGKTIDGDGHAWNIITINNKKYPIDLTLDNTRFRSGKFNTFDFLGQNINSFSETHIPDPWEPIQNYKNELSQIDPNIIKQFESQIRREKEYKSTTYKGIRSDNSKFIVAQVGYKTINNTNYFRYFYVDIDETGKKKAPIILYSETNLTSYMNGRKFKPQATPEFIGNIIRNILFSRENIANSLLNSTYYIGKITKNINSNKKEYVSSINEIKKDTNISNLFNYPTKCFKRSDGSVFIAQQMLKEPIEIKGINVMKYDIFEMIDDTIKKNTVFTEKNFFNDNRQSMIDDYLSRARLDRKQKEAGGYIGYYDSSGTRIYNPKLVSYFDISKKIDFNEMNNAEQLSIPTFGELKDLATSYELVSSNNGNINILNRKTGKLENDYKIVYQAIFANIWLTSAGMKWMYDEIRPGFEYAFNEPAEELYNIICNQLINDIKNNNVINTLQLFNNIKFQNDYKYNEQIISNLFGSPFKTKFINKFFLKALNKSENDKIPETLYSMDYAINESNFKNR